MYTPSEITYKPALATRHNKGSAYIPKDRSPLLKLRKSKLSSRVRKFPKLERRVHIGVRMYNSPTGDFFHGTMLSSCMAAPIQSMMLSCIPRATPVWFGNMWYVMTP